MTDPAALQDAIRVFSTRVKPRLAPDENGCLLWTRYRMANGYGKVSIDGRMHLVHRVAAAARYGPIPEGLYVDHLCRQPACANPNHLELVTPHENVRRGVWVELRKTCSNGHPWTPENVATLASGAKRCRLCHRLRDQESRQRRGR